MDECYNTACPYCIDYSCKRTATCDMYSNSTWIWKKPSDDCRCSNCGKIVDQRYPYCPNCGARMDEREWEEPEINPCRGCRDYDGRGGCLSNGGCGAKMDEQTNYHIENDGTYEVGDEL